MATILRFEDIEAWQKARALTQTIYQMTSHGEFARDFALRDQIRRAGVSSMSNIAEGFEREGNKEFIQFLTQSKGSTGEIKSQLYVALDARFITDPEFQRAYDLANETGRLIGGFIRYLQTSDLRGRKFSQA
jgi:four helix bundle protein